MNSILLPCLSHVTTYGCAWQCSVTLPTFPWGFPVYGQKHWLTVFSQAFLPVGSKQIYAAYGEWNWKSLILLSLFRARTACAISKSVSWIKRGKRPGITKGSLKMVFIYLALILLIHPSGDGFVRVLKYLRFVSGVINHDRIEIRRIRTFH